MQKKFHQIVWQIKKSPPHRSWVSSVIADKAVLLAPVHHFASLPRKIQWHNWHRSPLQWRDRVGFKPNFPIKPEFQEFIGTLPIPI